MENEINPTPTTIETNLSTLFTSSQPRKEFVDDLAMKLHFQYLNHKSSRIEIQPQRDNWFLAIQKKFRARPVMLILSVLVALLVLTGIVYAVSRLSGYIPGFGFASGSQSIYVLEESTEVEENGLILQVEQAVSDEGRFWVKLRVENLDDLPFFSSSYLLLEDGTRIERESGGSSDQDGLTSLTYSFPALPADTTTLTLFIENLADNPIQLPLTLRPIRNGELIPVTKLGEYPISSPTQHGLRLSLDHIAPGSDRTVFQVSVQFDDTGTIIIGQWTVSLMDQDGRSYPLTEITMNNIDRGKAALFQTIPFTGNEELILKLQSVPQIEKKINVMRDYSTKPGKFIFNPGVDPQAGQIWELDEQVQVGDLTLNVVRAELNNANELIFEFEAQQDVTGVMLYADTPEIKSARGGVPAGDQNFNAVIGFHQLPNDPIEIQIRAVYFRIAGEWQINWTPPKSPDQSTVQALPTATIPVFPTPTATIPSEDALYLEVKRLTDQFDTPYQQGPGWVHVVIDKYFNPRPGQDFPPPYLRTEIWYEIDEEGYVLRSLYTDYDENDVIMQQVATIGDFSVNFTFGHNGYNGSPKYRPTLDMLIPSLLSASEIGSETTREEVKCDNGKNCLLITILDRFDQPFQNRGDEKATAGVIFKVWIDIETGLQFKSESQYIMGDGSQEQSYIETVKIVEKVDQAPEEIVGILDRVVLP